MKKVMILSLIMMLFMEASTSKKVTSFTAPYISNKNVGNILYSGGTYFGIKGFANLFKNSIPYKILLFPVTFTADFLGHVVTKSLGVKGPDFSKTLDAKYTGKQIIKGGIFSSLAVYCFKLGKEIKNLKNQ